MTMHTPGPWRVVACKRTDGCGNYYCVEASKGYAKGRFYAVCCNRADAALIAAAPDLLAALRPFAALAGALDCANIYNDARIAVAKAAPRHFSNADSPQRLIRDLADVLEKEISKAEDTK